MPTLDEILGSTGEERSAWLTRKTDALDKKLSYYLGPAYEPISNIARIAGMLSPGADMMDMAQSSDALMKSPTWKDAGLNALGLGAATLGAFIPGTARGIEEAVDTAADATRKGIRAYHGSPHDFDKFSLEHIGKGEGAQAYGHGLYFAEAEDTARAYQKALANIAHPDRGPEWVAKQWLSENGGDVATAEAALRESITSWKSNPIANNDPQLREMIANMESAIPLLGRVTPEPGALYTTRLNVEPDDLLDWDKPLSEQSEKVKKALEKVGFKPPETVIDYERGPLPKEGRHGGMANPDGWVVTVKAKDGRFASGVGVDRASALADAESSFMPKTGAQFYEKLARELDGSAGQVWGRGSGATSDRLREAGIPGIRYLDQGSRGAGEGTRNFVIFDDSLISIESID